MDGTRATVWYNIVNNVTDVDLVNRPKGFLATLDGTPWTVPTEGTIHIDFVAERYAHTFQTYTYYPLLLVLKLCIVSSTALYAVLATMRTTELPEAYINLDWIYDLYIAHALVQVLIPWPHSCVEALFLYCVMCMQVPKYSAECRECGWSESACWQLAVYPEWAGEVQGDAVVRYSTSTDYSRICFTSVSWLLLAPYWLHCQYIAVHCLITHVRCTNYCSYPLPTYLCSMTPFRPNAAHTV
jgi:hypothetical protein